jgi:outer membrane protein assembly factor BamB
MTDRRFSRRALLAGVGAATASLAGCTAPTDSDATETSTAAEPATTSEGTSDPAISLSSEAAWSTFGHDAGHTGHNPRASGVGSDPEQAWSSPVDGIYTLREPAVADGTVFIGSKQSLWAFDAASGEAAWTTYMDGMTHHFAPTYRDGTLYALAKQSGGVDNAATGFVSAIDPGTGEIQWSVGAPVTSTVTHDGSRLVVAAKEDGAAYVQALDAASGEPQWRFDVPDADRSSITGTPAYANGTLYVPATLLAADGTKSGRLYALDPETADVQWTVETSGALAVSPVATGNRVYVAARDGTVRALTPDGGTEWTADAGARVYTRPTFADGRLFVLTAGDVVAFGDGGEKLWRAGSERTQMTGMSVGGDTLYVGGEPLFALDVATGDVRFDLPVSVYHGAYGAPVAVEDVLYAGICIKDELGARYDNYVRAYAP